MKDRYTDLHLSDDPYLTECARWRAALGDARKPKAPPSRARWPHWGLAVCLGAILGVLLAY